MKYIKRLYEFLNTPTKKYYHGSKELFDTFSLHNNKTYQEIDLPVWFFTENEEYAKTYGSYLYVVELDINNTFDTLNKKHEKIFIDYLKEENKTSDEIDNILDEQFFNHLPYWTCDDAYYCAISNGFDSILIQEELASEVLSIGVFDVDNIKIINIKNV